MQHGKRETDDLKRVAVLVDTSTTWGREVIAGIHRYSCGGVGWQLFVEARGVEERYWLPPSWHGDGVIARVGYLELAKRLRALRLPVVNVSGIGFPEAGFPRVTSDQAAAASMAAAHLLERGFKHFAYFNLLGLEYVSEHRQAFEDCLRLAGHRCGVFSVHPQLGVEPDWSLDLRRLGKWLADMPRPLAVFTWNTSSAREVIYACSQCDLAVPEEVAVLSGSNDDLLCDVAPVPISAVRLGAEQIGFQAAAALDAWMRAPGSRPAGDVLIPPMGVIERRSTDSLAIDDPSLVKALRFIRENPARAIQVSDVAHEAGMCRRALEQRFQQVLGRSPAAEIRRVRIECAIQMLRYTNLSVALVAERSGFSSPEYMSSVFRQYLSTTPLHYRKAERSSRR